MSGSNRPPRSVRSRVVFWSTPAIGTACGVAYLVASWRGGHPWAGAAMLVFMVAVSAGAVLAARWSETVAGLMDRQDERLVGIDLHATAATGIVLVLAVIVGALVELARGRSGTPYTWLGALGGVAYVGAVLVGRRRG